MHNGMIKVITGIRRRGNKRKYGKEHEIMLNKKTVDDLTGLQGKKVLVRCDFNVPLKEGVIQNYNRTVPSVAAGGAAAGRSLPPHRTVRGRRQSSAGAPVTLPSPNRQIFPNGVCRLERLAQ